jgi:hypothetical protein
MLGLGLQLQQIIGGFKGLLDYYTNAAAAYSLRQLKSDQINVVRVRRDSDNEERDFSATEVSNGTLESWVGTSGTDNGFVTTWYDQSGNSNDATQATASAQPLIVDSGVLVTENGKAALDFDGTNDAFIASSVNVSQPNTFFTVAKRDVTTGGKRNLFDGLTSRQELGLTSFDLPLKNFISTLQPIKGISTPSTNQELQMSLFDGASSALYINEILDASGTLDNQPITSLGIGRDTDASDYFDGKYQELILYPSNQSANRADIESNINNYFNIYP